MRQRVKKRGNSLYLRIPEAIAEELDLQENSEVELSIQGRHLIIEPVPSPGYTLDELLAQVTPKNRHAETNWGPAIGKEKM